jgi:phosphoribosylformylglycinamidine synthase
VVLCPKENEGWLPVIVDVLANTQEVNLASPLQILVDASDGASDKFGEPLIHGCTKTFGMRPLNGERREWLKPIMFSGAIGQIDHAHISKGDTEIGMLPKK